MVRALILASTLQLPRFQAAGSWIRVTGAHAAVHHQVDGFLTFWYGWAGWCSIELRMWQVMRNEASLWL